MPEMSLTARWIVPVSSRPVENGRVVLEGGRICRVEKNTTPQASDVDYGDAIILPGFINAHTHLELTAFHGRAPYTGSFADWLRAIILLQMIGSVEQTMQQAIGDGLRQSLTAGVTTVVDTGCGEQAMELWRQASINVVGLMEVLGIGPRARGPHSRSIGSVIDLLAAAPQHGVRVGISPHAPYSTAPDVYRQAIAYAADHGLPICTHLAETRDEIEFLAHGTGAFRELLEEGGLWDGSFTPPGCSPVEYAETLGLLACSPLLAHVNYVTDTDIALLAERHCTVAYCPRTHRFFQHEPHSYRQMLEHGVNVCIGTDSLASAPSLSILDDLRFLRDADSSCASDVLLEMGTLRGARAVNMESQVGSLEPGKQADLVVVPLTHPGTGAPVDDLLRGTAQPLSVWVAGQRLHGDR
jgi:cytosine/adenosine deaminase-related metal-dependent hydrolase